MRLRPRDDVTAPGSGRTGPILSSNLLFLSPQGSEPQEPNLRQAPNLQVRLPARSGRAWAETVLENRGVSIRKLLLVLLALHWPGKTPSPSKVGDPGRAAGGGGPPPGGA